MAYQIPLFDLNFDEREAQAAYDTIRSGWISTGPKNETLEKMFIGQWRTPYAVSTSSCTAALHLCCLTAGIQQGDEVLCPSLTFAASVNCIRYVGALPVFCDIVGPDHLNIDPVDMERKITPRTKAVVVVHFAGFPARMDEIMAVARRHGLKVIEDACHGPLSEYKGEKLGTIGDCAAFSFFSNKNISTGEGGMFLTRHAEMAEKARLLRSHGMTTMSYQRAGGHATSYDVVALGYNYRLDDIRAAIAIEQLKKLPADLARRAEIRRHYEERLCGLEGLYVPFAGNGEYVSNYIFPVVLASGGAARRDTVREALHAAGIQTSVHYPAVHRFSICAGCAAELPRTEFVCDHEITLPMYAALTDAQVDFICDTLIEQLHA